jgi:hypothetical protein
MSIITTYQWSKTSMKKIADVDCMLHWLIIVLHVSSQSRRWPRNSFVCLALGALCAPNLQSLYPRVPVQLLNCLYLSTSMGQPHIDNRIVFRPAPSTWDFMYNRQRPPLYYGGQKQKYYLPRSTAALPSEEGSAVATNSNGTQSAHKGKRRDGGRSRYYSHVYGQPPVI